MPDDARVTERALNVRLPANLHDAVRHFAFDRRESIANVIRQALSEHLTRNGWADQGRGSSRRASTARKR